MDFAETLFRTSLNLECTMFPRAVFPNLAIRYTLGWLQELTGISVPWSRGEEMIHRTPEEAESLRASLASPAHLAERERILPFIQGPHVLELGSGSGGFLKLIRDRCHDLELLVGVEGSPLFFEYAAETLFPHSQDLGKPIAVLARADITKITLAPDFYTSVVLASILHEIKSYCGRESVYPLLRNIHKGLAPGGRVIIYDGFRKPGEMSLVELLTPEAVSRFEEYISHTPRILRLQRNGCNILMPTSDAVDFSAKLQFDATTEYGEQYYPFSLQAYQRMLRSAGFEPVTFSTFPEELDMAFLQRHVRVTGLQTDRDELTASNNVMLIAEKRKPLLSAGDPFGAIRELQRAFYLDGAYAATAAGREFQPA